ncbi:uracil-DNA glycosylase [Paraburkholderia sp. RP-4-7]|uniref:Type-4 uracil-DNA glycosylase n=1 Tax=Paraburkholderia polaris TaxID=2728848 RepID=A0A848I3V1_9BURK|nr:uracil-DNA glycosylase family protein [Paraburkholderia polaris]NML97031.1 uracil-DNA glycosylase [Paraburkholderia polaris]
MALHESVLEEFGLAPLWVRRGMAAREPVVEAGVEQDTAALSAPVARRDDPRMAAREASSAALAQDGRQAVSANDAARPAMRAGEAQQADAAQAPAERRAPVRAVDQTPPVAEARARFDRGAPTRASDSPRSMQESERGAGPSAEEPSQGRLQAPVDARQPVKQPSQQSRAPEPPAFDAPPDDDFAWFDDQPAHTPAEARRETPEPSSIQTLDWDALSEQVATCQRCRLCEKRTNTVFGVGDRNADWMLIGEAPGENEDRLGEPFVGQAGKLLDNMLRSLTLARDTNVYIANVIKCRPPGNRNPEPDEVARCEPYLQRQVALVKPKLIVALGRFAAQSLLKTEASISSLRGRVHEYEGVPVIVTYHPAYLLRSLPDKAKAWADLCLARDTWLAAGGVPSSAAK